MEEVERPLSRASLLAHRSFAGYAGRGGATVADLMLCRARVYVLDVRLLPQPVGALWQ